MPINFRNIVGFESVCESNGLTVDWDIAGGCMVYSQPTGQGDKANKRAGYHIHIFFNWNDDPPHQITSIKPKSGNFADPHRPELVNLAYGSWAGAVVGADARTKDAVARLANVFLNGGF